MRVRTITIFIATGLLTACVPTRQDYDAYVTLLQGSSRAKNEAVKDCVRGFDGKSTRNLGLLTNTSDKDAVRVGCDRFIAAVVSGRATYDDVVDIKGQRLTSKTIKIFQGR
ncbi:hypothetical protein AMC90_CH01951 [Rhizobium phaseoli]|uniref:Lipoprotein n=1 Tax=Rhizobium phaseoli TaxID=396 RepID=A0A192TBL2_9HYPH|nr:MULTISPECIES: hypothetical protein [Rhizobium]MDH6647969.1 hypothetical protein [Rhizobium esperanzae]ANL27776.1 hypothetical protein AMC90_CH01951 [Rhizobium phaseoli]ANL40377.1 hypothetical protein AMC88_CH01987 [Rhizobium phaseoli]ANL53133.1 hypothetical protein AMC86_CH01993 [Rhizobium phaseoli]ANL59365.1 hypothetical protein AMC85_CH01986 [Rhizobium phaseoli]